VFQPFQPFNRGACPELCRRAPFKPSTAGVQTVRIVSTVQFRLILYLNL